MKYYIIVGEASGDLHGSNLMREMSNLDTQANFRCWGGDKMEAAGGHIVKHYRDLAFMGFVEVVRNLSTIMRNIRFCKEDITAYAPDVLILVDYPGFNLRIAEWAKQQGYKVVYYIAPQVWAWKANRVKKMKKCIDLMLCILPFEKKYFADRWNWDVTYVGHPLAEVIGKAQEDPSNKESLLLHEAGSNTGNLPIIALLPGSRKQEIAKKLPIMLSVAEKYPQYQFIIARAPGMDDDFYMPYTSAYKNVFSVKNQTYRLLNQSKAALVTSGTATLETALFGVPEVVCYKGSPISYAIAKRVIKISYISLVNLIMDKLVVKELIQHELTRENIVTELDLLLQNEARKEQLQQDYKQLRALLQQDGNASRQAAQAINAFLAQ